jgi:glycosyltransferase involved in cell wall biosynthesis
MTVLQLISSGGFYGAESMLVNLSGALGPLGCRAVVAAFQNSQNPHTEVIDRARDLGLSTEIIPCQGRIDRKAMQRIRDLVRRYRVDVVHTHGSKPNTYAYLAARKLGLPLIATYHLDWPDRGLNLHFYHLLDRVVLRRFAKVAGVSEKIVQSLRFSGIPEKRLTMVRNGIDFSPFFRSHSALRDEIGRGKRAVIGVVARLTPQKGHKYLLSAVPGIVHRFPDVLFVFVGDGPERQELEAMVQRERLDEFVVFAGQKADMPDVYAALDIFVLPSVNEGMPMAIIEAMAAGKPVIATRVGAVPQLIHSGETGLLVEPADVTGLETEIGRLLADTQFAQRLAAKGRSQVLKCYSAHGMAETYLSLYKEAMKVPARNADYVF